MIAEERFPFISVLIPTRDRFSKLSACLDRLSGQGYPPEMLEILVLDDGGTDGTAGKIGEAVRLKFPGISGFQAFSSRSPLGVSGARNFLISRMKPIQGFALFLDDDVYMAPACLSELADRLSKSPDIAAVGPRVVAAADPGAVMFSANFVSPWTARYTSRDPSGPVRCDWLDPACLLVRKEALAAVGGFAEDFFRSHEGVDFCLKLGERGYGVLYVPAAAAAHDSDLAPVLSEERLYYLYRNKFKVIHSRFKGVRRACALLFNLLFGTLRHIFGEVNARTRWWRRSWIAIKASADGIRDKAGRIGL